jgi:sugar lactone lactonase YvrE
LSTIGRGLSEMAHINLLIGTAGFGSNTLFYPYKIWKDASSGMLYVADSYNHRIMRYANNAASGVIIAGGNGSGTAGSQLSFPYGFYFDSFSNSLLIANAGVNNIVRWTIGASNWTLVAGDASGASGSSAILLASPSGVTLDPMGNIYVADMNNQRIQYFSSGQSSGVTIAGSTGSIGSSSTLLCAPSSVMLDNQLNLYVVDAGNSRIQMFPRY